MKNAVECSKNFFFPGGFFGQNFQDNQAIWKQKISQKFFARIIYLKKWILIEIQKNDQMENIFSIE